MAELVSLKADVILADGVEAALAAKRGTNSVPIVFLTGTDPVEEGLVASLARPAGNVTGQSTLISEASALTFSLMKQIMPRLSRLSQIWDPDIWDPDLNARALRIMRTARHIAEKNAVQFQALPVIEVPDVRFAFERIRVWGAHAVWVAADGLLCAHCAQLGKLAAEHRVPMFGGLREYADAGGVMAYAPDYNDAYRRAAAQVDKVLRGAKPANLPVERATRLSLVINLKAAKSLKLAIPQTVLRRADRVIE
jgi:putative ABC transport system substrate-binding protein